MTDQTQIGDIELQLKEAENYILITVNGDDVSIFSTFDDDLRTDAYLDASLRAVRR